MPRRSRNAIVDDDDDDNESVDDEEEQRKPSPKRGRRSKVVVEEDEEEEEEQAMEQKLQATTQNSLALCSQAPETTQDILPVRDSERSKFLQLGNDRREKAVVDVLRLVLFKALSGEPIDRLKIAKEAHINEDKISGAVFEEVNTRLENLFALQLRRVPAFLERMKDFPAKCKDRYYIVNLADDEDHLKLIHSVHKTSSIEKGLLMTILGFIFCKGNARNDDSRWLLDKDLYQLLHTMDENLPPEPPTPGSTRATQKVVDGAPDVDAALDRFVKMDYLFRLKANDELMNLNDQADDTSFFYAMGTRAAVEIGRKQVLHFLSQTRTYSLVTLAGISNLTFLTDCALQMVTLF